MQVDEVDAIEEIFAERMLLHHLTKVGIRGADHTHIGAACMTVTQHLVGLILQHTQQLHLTGNRQFSYLVQKDSAASG